VNKKKTMKQISRLVQKQNNCSINRTNGNFKTLLDRSVTRSYVKQPKLRKYLKPRLTKEEIERAKGRKSTLRPLRKKRPKHAFVPVVISSRIEKQNQEMFEEWEKEGYVPGTKIIHEEKAIKDYVETIKELKEQEETKKRGEFHHSYKRAGALAVKMGMTRTFDENGLEIPLTCLYIPRCIVTQSKTMEKDGVEALQLGSGFRNQVKQVEQGHLRKSLATFLDNRQRLLNGKEAREGTLRSPVQIDYGSKLNSYPQTVIEMKISKEAQLPIGTEITAAHFEPGQYVDVGGKSKGHGFTGVIKRWGFSGHPRTHGSNKDHRKPGSLHSGLTRVIPNKKMPGRHGFYTKYVRSLLVYAVDLKENYVFVKGSVPGAKGRYVLIKDTVFDTKRNKNLPFPTYLGREDRNETKHKEDNLVFLLNTKEPTHEYRM